MSKQHIYMIVYVYIHVYLVEQFDHADEHYMSHSPGSRRSHHFILKYDKAATPCNKHSHTYLPCNTVHMHVFVRELLQTQHLTAPT